MTNQRRQYLKAAGALGALSLLPAMPSAFASESKLKANADAILKAATDAGDVYLRPVLRLYLSGLQQAVLLNSPLDQLSDCVTYHSPCALIADRRQGPRIRCIPVVRQ